MPEDREQQFQRLLRLTAQLLGSNGLSVRELGGHDPASRRKIQRDLNKLRDSGLPLHSTEGEESVPRYRIDNLRMAGSQLNLEETLALTLATSLAGKSQLGKLARQGWTKLHYAVANGEERMTKNDLPQRVSVRTEWELPIELLTTISQALLQCRRLRLLYQGFRDSAPRWRRIEPWQLFFQDRWYVHAWDPDSETAKNFRVERIRHVETLNETFLIPASQRGVSPHFHKWDLLGDEPVTIHCRVDEQLSRWLLENPVHPSQQVEGSSFSLSVRDPESFLRWALGLSHCEILDPPILRERMRARLQEMLQRLD